MELQLKHITKVFGNNGTGKTVLEDISLHVKDRAFISLLGPSGCGKTTLLSIIAGFRK